ncbi:alpha/beta hydrolase [Pirellulaceae bacterium SH501]
MKRFSLCCFFAGILAFVGIPSPQGSFTAAQAQTAESVVVKVWPGKAPGVTEELKEKEFTEGGKKMVAGEPIYLTSDITSPELVLFRAKSDSPSPAVVICPGGGHRLLAYDLEGTELAQWLNSLDITAVVLKYRVPSNNKDFKCLPALQDAQRAMRVVRSKATEWGIDATRLGVMGFSAGGEVAARISLQFQQEHYNKTDEIDGLSCKPDFSMLIYPAYLVDKDELRPEIDPRKHPTPAELPPFFMVHTWDDPVTPISSIELAKALKQANRSCELHLFDRGGHGYGIRHVDGVPVTDWTRAAEPWLKLQVGPKK